MAKGADGKVGSHGLLCDLIEIALDIVLELAPNLEAE